MSRWFGNSRNDPLNKTIEINFESLSAISSEQGLLPFSIELGQGQEYIMSQEQGSIISAIPEAPQLGGLQRGAQLRSTHGQGY